METVKWTKCRACGGSDLRELFHLGDQHVSGFPRPGEWRDQPRCPIVLDQCASCTLVQQRFSVPSELLYSRHYWYRSGTTNTMRRALADVVDAAMSRVKLEPGDVVLDVGSNDGTLLMQYPEGLLLNRVGVEPAHNLATAENYENRGLGCIRRFWEVDEGAPPAPRPAKIITACGMLYDLDDPTAFLRATAAALAPDGLFVAQLQCLRQTLALRDVGNLCHEHLEFYTLKSLNELFVRCGLTVLDVEENGVNGGSYRLYARRSQPGDYGQRTERAYDFMDAEKDAGLTDVTGFRMQPAFSAMQANLRNLWQTVESMVRAGKRVWTYGASTKGNVILQAANLGPELIQAAADRSPEKVGRTTANGVPVRSEADFRAAAPDFALVLPYTFLPEFEAREAAWRRGGGRWIVPIPEVRVT